MTGSLPHSPQMVKALTNYKQEPDGTFKATGVAENRIAPFLMYVLHANVLIDADIPVAAQHLV